MTVYCQDTDNFYFHKITDTSLTRHFRGIIAHVRRHMETRSQTKTQVQEQTEPVIESTQATKVRYQRHGWNYRISEQKSPKTFIYVIEDVDVVDSKRDEIWYGLRHLDINESISK